MRNEYFIRYFAFTRVAETIKHNPGLFKIACSVLPLNVLDNDEKDQVEDDDDYSYFEDNSLSTERALPLSDMRLEKIHEAQTLRVAEILLHNSELFKIANAGLPPKAVVDDNEKAQVECC